MIDDVVVHHVDHPHRGSLAVVVIIVIEAEQVTGFVNVGVGINSTFSITLLHEVETSPGMSKGGGICIIFVI